jgi:hypothetical protein
MSDFEIRIPYRSRDEQILETLNDLRHALDGDDRAVARELLTEAMLRQGKETIGEVA